jgi:hypothetical protein
VICAGSDWVRNAGQPLDDLRPCRLCGVLVFMEDAAEPVSSEDVELIELAWFAERLGCRP